MYARSRQSAAPPYLDNLAVGFGTGSTGTGPALDLRYPWVLCSCYVVKFRCRKPIERRDLDLSVCSCAVQRKP